MTSDVGHSETTIATATSLSVEFIQRVLAEPGTTQAFKDDLSRFPAGSTEYISNRQHYEGANVTTTRRCMRPGRTDPAVEPHNYARETRP